MTVFKQVWGENIRNRTVFGDKIYSDFEYFNEEKQQKQNMEMLTPVKSVKGQSEMEKQRIKAFDDLFSTAVSGIKPI